ncbi:MAG: deoxyguanosinetriphosphate triphosphohydrolase [Lachnospiraceae bacterium]|nr:deoxyguanosinetriphosphate triphosphohydrolase [Lachnospiraceae bacterium]
METIRVMREKEEHEVLSPYAAFSDCSLGRDVMEKECDIRTCFERDRDRIIHSKAFRRLSGKTQVFLTPQGDHYRTRLTHTLEVSQIARTIARALKLNECLTEAIALGHDLGHTPFGHAGERALDRATKIIGFSHHEQSLRVVELLEERRNGVKGLNLTQEVRDGIVNHRSNGKPSTLEGCVVRYADKIAYVNHDIDDAIRGNIIKESDIPAEYARILGDTLSDRLNTLIHDVVTNSIGTDDVKMSEKVGGALAGLRKYMFASVYTSPIAKGQEKKAERMVEFLFEYYKEHRDDLPEELKKHIEEGDGREFTEQHLYSEMELIERRTERAVCDYIAGMTDRFAVTKFNEIMVPQSWNIY